MKHFFRRRWWHRQPSYAEVLQAAQIEERAGSAPGWPLPAEISNALPHMPEKQLRVFTDKLRRMPMWLPADSERVDAEVLRYLQADIGPMEALRRARESLERVP